MPIGTNNPEGIYGVSKPTGTEELPPLNTLPERKVICLSCQKEVDIVPELTVDRYSALCPSCRDIAFSEALKK